METVKACVVAIVVMLAGCGTECDATMRDEAAKVAPAWCGLTGRCQSTPWTATAVRECSTKYVETICGSADCDADAPDLTEEVDACVAALNARACTPAGIPPECSQLANFY